MAYRPPARQRPAQRRLPDHPGVGHAARGEPGDDGVGGGHAARAAVHDHRRHRLDDVDERARASRRSRSSSRSTATSTPPPRTCRRPSPRRRRCCRPDMPTPPTLPEGEPGRPAGHLPRAELAHACRCTRWTSTRRRTSPSASRRSAASPRCTSSARRSTRCASRSTRGRSPRAGIGIDEVEQAIARGNVNKPTGTLYGTAPGRQRAGHRPAHGRRRLPAAHRRLPQRLAGAPRGDRPRDRQRRDRQGRELVQRRARGGAGGPAPARARTPSRWSTPSARCCRASASSCPPP